MRKIIELKNITLIRLLEAGNDAQGRRLAAARWTKEGNEFVFVYDEVEIV